MRSTASALEGGTIKRITERVSPRVFRVVALPAPTERERSQMYIQRYLPHLPAAGEVVTSTAAGTTAPAWSG
jgi:polyphosphate kinase 2 (PPK2 family)